MARLARASSRLAVEPTGDVRHDDRRKQIDEQADRGEGQQDQIQKVCWPLRTAWKQNRIARP